MTKDALLKRLDILLSDAQRERCWGQIEIELKDGEATLLRKTSTERLDADKGRTHDQSYRR